MKLRVERLIAKVGQTFEIPDWSYNHAYGSVDGEEIKILYLVPDSEDDAKKAMAPKSQKESAFG